MPQVTCSLFTSLAHHVLLLTDSARAHEENPYENAAALHENPYQNVTYGGDTDEGLYDDVALNNAGSEVRRPLLLLPLPLPLLLPLPTAPALSSSALLPSPPLSISLLTSFPHSPLTLN